MNYALDALWWRLKDPAVRDLASLLTAPPLWHSGIELPVRELLGADGFRFLLALDGEPLPLYRHLAGEAPFGHRLGLYAESLLAFWLAHAPHGRLLARNLPLYRPGGQTAGAADFVCCLNGQLWHLELACKYYGGRSAADFRGLNPNDTLRGKAEKLLAQSRLLHTGAAADVRSRRPQGIRSATVVRGVGFSPDGRLSGGSLNRLGWSGLLLADWRDAGGEDGQRFCPLPRMNLLAPARVAGQDTWDAAELAEYGGGMAAVVVLRPDGMWHEVRRLMRQDG